MPRTCSPATVTWPRTSSRTPWPRWPSTGRPSRRRATRRPTPAPSSTTAPSTRGGCDCAGHGWSASRPSSPPTAPTCPPSPSDGCSCRPHGPGHARTVPDLAATAWSRGRRRRRRVRSTRVALAAAAAVAVVVAVLPGSWDRDALPAAPSGSVTLGHPVRIARPWSVSDLPRRGEPLAAVALSEGMGRNSGWYGVTQDGGLRRLPVRGGFMDGVVPAFSRRTRPRLRRLRRRPLPDPRRRDRPDHDLPGGGHHGVPRRAARTHLPVRRGRPDPRLRLARRHAGRPGRCHDRQRRLRRDPRARHRRVGPPLGGRLWVQPRRLARRPHRARRRGARRWS